MVQLGQMYITPRISCCNRIIRRLVPWENPFTKSKRQVSIRMYLLYTDVCMIEYSDVL